MSESSPLLNKDLVNAFLKGVKDTLKLMANTNAETKSAFIEKQSLGRGEVSGIIGMVSDDLKGTMSITFTKESIFHILGNMLDERFEELNEEVADAVGELTNMIYGVAKTTLNEAGHSFEMAIPTVIIGTHKIKTVHKGATLVIPLSCPGGDFFVELTVQA